MAPLYSVCVCVCVAVCEGSLAAPDKGVDGLAQGWGHGVEEAPVLRICPACPVRGVHCVPAKEPARMCVRVCVRRIEGRRNNARVHRVVVAREDAEDVALGGEHVAVPEGCVEDVCLVEE